jgi:hypothetical protein
MVKKAEGRSQRECSEFVFRTFRILVCTLLITHCLLYSAFCLLSQN